MKRNAILCGALLAACGGSPKPAPIELTPAPHPTPAVAVNPPVEEPADPNLAFRLSYSNPGGMWMPAQMTLPQHQDTFRKMGVKLPAEALSNPLSDTLSSIVSLGGCSASFVSPDGLIVTNHHCVQGALKYLSTKDNNLIENGFLAQTREEELSAGPDKRVMVVQSYKDITHEMRDGLEAIKDPVARKDEKEKRYKQQIAACEKDRPWLRCSVSNFFNGGQYQLIEMLEIKDVRLVYVPHRAVGNYGGEIDNWAWPRHTGDWSFYRAYVGKDGKPAEFSPDNIPYKPAHWLKVSTAGLKVGDFVMVTGYPGSTSRTDTAASIHHEVEWYLPYAIAAMQEKYKMLESHLGDNNETALAATTAKQGTQNYLEKYQDMLEGLTKGDLLRQKDDLDRRVIEWAAQPGHEEHKAAIEKMMKMESDEFRTARVDYDRGAALRGSRLLATATSFTRWAEERVKKNEDRKPGYQDRDMPRALAGQKSFARSFDRTLDRDGFRLTLVRALQLPEQDRAWLATLLGAKKGQKLDEAFIDKTLDAWYGATKLEDPAVRIALLESGTSKQLKASKDPFVKAAQRIWPLLKAEEKKDDAKAGEMMLVEPHYADAMRQVLGGAMAPDANGTLRITYGTVKPLADGAAFTTASQIPAKDTGAEPFDAPKPLLAAIKAKRYGRYADPAIGNELPVDFLSDLDITNGNSGSATLNDKGELVGLAFDGNKEGVASDVVFNPSVTRTIHVDARYMIWVMDTLDHADHLIKEMGLQPQL